MPPIARWCATPPAPGKLSVPVTSGAPGEAIHVLVPTHQLATGKYVLVMIGLAADKETELARFPYTLQIK